MDNNYFILRHGEALCNQKKIISCWPEKSSFPLTEKGRKEIKRMVPKLKNKRIDLIFTSDILRTRQTAEIVGKELGIKPKEDKRLREYNAGIFNGESLNRFREFFKNEEERFFKKPPKGEIYLDITKRMSDFLKEIDKKYSNKNILIVSHQLPLILLEGRVKGYSQKEVLKKFPKEKRIKTGELRQL